MKAASYIKCSAAGLIAISRGTLAGYKVFTRLAPGEWLDSVFYEVEPEQFGEPCAAEL